MEAASLLNFPYTMSVSPTTRACKGSDNGIVKIKIRQPDDQNHLTRRRHVKRPNSGVHQSSRWLTVKKIDGIFPLCLKTPSITATTLTSFNDTPKTPQ